MGSTLQVYACGKCLTAFSRGSHNSLRAKGVTSVTVLSRGPCAVPGRELKRVGIARLLLNKGACRDTISPVFARVIHNVGGGNGY